MSTGAQQYFIRHNTKGWDGQLYDPLVMNSLKGFTKNGDSVPDCNF
jgi:hypothetical protein